MTLPALIAYWREPIIEKPGGAEWKERSEHTKPRNKGGALLLGAPWGALPGRTLRGAARQTSRA